MIRIAVLEDEKIEAEKLRAFLNRIKEEQKIEFQSFFYATIHDFERDYASQFEVLLLDIELPDGNGMELAKRIRLKDASVSIIFVTHLAQYAISGYSVGALDYILKPVEYPSFAMKMQRALIRIRQTKEEFITINSGTNLVRTSTWELKYIEIYKHHIYYHVGDRIIESYGILSKVEPSLPSRGFFRCSNSFIINFRFVDWIDSSNVYIGDKAIPVSRSKKKELLAEYHRYYGDLDEE